MPLRRHSVLTLILLTAFVPASLQSQWRALTTIGSVQEDRLRLSQLADSASADGFLMRTSGTLGGAAAHGWHAFVVRPEIDLRWNDRLPLSLNDGAMWSGRGANTLVRGGVGVSYGWLSLVVAPEYTFSQNLGFEVFPGREPGRSNWSSPWHTGAHSADLPPRFGDQPFAIVTAGQSALTVRAGPLALGASSENQWWGPGVRNALLLSNQAQGVPHLFARSSRPWVSGAGDFEWRVIAGALTESIYFDTRPGNDYRSLSGFIVTFRPSAERNLAIGLARIVVAPARGRRTVLQGAFNAFIKWRTADDPRTDADSLAGDQMTSLFARWIFPKDHFELYAEWAKSELPRSLREMLIAPHNAQGYTLGTQWAIPVRGGRASVRLSGEATVTDQSIVLAEHPSADFYTGRTTAQGFTERGQLLGAAVGPGGQAQSLGADYVVNGGSVGVLFGRIRWEDDALYRQDLPNFLRHDVTLLAQLRGSVRAQSWDYSASLTANRRLNYLFQNGLANPLGRRTIDVPNISVTFLVSPR